ncbi:MAG TPA: hypothetical protein VMD59_24295 [Acidimicrobiales bacterium]|nr:hypothetical protein [Acidimicrobiales bacterium]
MLLFLGHRAGHEQIFASRLHNRAFGLLTENLLSGLSFGRQASRHDALHDYPNRMGSDPDDTGAVAPPPASGAKPVIEPAPS